MKREKITKKELPKGNDFKEKRREELKDLMGIFKQLQASVKEIKKVKDSELKKELADQLFLIIKCQEMIFKKLFDFSTLSTGFFAKYIKDIDKAFEKVDERVSSIEKILVMLRAYELAGKGKQMTETEVQNMAGCLNLKLEPEIITEFYKRGVIRPEEGLRQ